MERWVYFEDGQAVKFGANVTKGQRKRVIARILREDRKYFGYCPRYNFRDWFSQINQKTFTGWKG